MLDSFDSLMKWDNDFFSHDNLSKDQLILTSTSENSNYDYALRMFGTKNLGVREDLLQEVLSLRYFHIGLRY